MVSEKEIYEMSYTDFVGFVNQTNVMPGAHDTISRWISFGKVDANSRILEIACTTGFSSREIARRTGCTGIGIDISEQSVMSARKNAESAGVDIKYFVKDAYEFEADEKFSHIILGAALKFFPEPESLLDKVTSLLQDGGMLLVSPFYAEGKISKELIKKCQNVFEITPTFEGYKEIMWDYHKFEILYEQKKELIKETQQELEHYCSSTINRACKYYELENKQLRKAMYERLMIIKQTSNELRDQQNYVVLVLRFSSVTYPNRYVELF